jgi:predicted DNA-binding protein (UPF0251 family)
LEIVDCETLRAIAGKLRGALNRKISLADVQDFAYRCFCGAIDAGAFTDPKYWDVRNCLTPEFPSDSRRLNPGRMLQQALDSLAEIESTIPGKCLRDRDGVVATARETITSLKGGRCLEVDVVGGLDAASRIVGSRSRSRLAAQARILREYLRENLLALADLIDTQAGAMTVGVASSNDATQPSARRRPRGSAATTKSRPLTSNQAETVQIVGECKGNIAEAARRLGRNRKTVEETYRAAMTKLGKTVVRSKTRTHLFSRDRRGQEDVADGDDQRNQ